jgi:ABC-2 type transport system ATP-binding protein
MAVDDVSFTVQPGEILAVLGGNGAGKTTTINLFLNLIEPTRGEACICGFITHKEPLLAKRHVAFVSENVMLHGNFTALENVEYFTRLGAGPPLSKDDYAAALRRVGLADESHEQKVRTFSKGMRQKCGIAIAILKNAQAILLDEPTSGLDPKAGFEFLRLLDSLRRDGRAILMSTHDIFRARDIADTIAIMDRGRLVTRVPASSIAQGDVEQFYIRYLAGHNGEDTHGGNGNGEG